MILHRAADQGPQATHERQRLARIIFAGVQQRIRMRLGAQRPAHGHVAGLKRTELRKLLRQTELHVGRTPTTGVHRHHCHERTVPVGGQSPRVGETEIMGCRVPRIPSQYVEHLGRRLIVLQHTMAEVVLLKRFDIEFLALEQPVERRVSPAQPASRRAPENAIRFESAPPTTRQRHHHSQTFVRRKRAAHVHLFVDPHGWIVGEQSRGELIIPAIRQLVADAGLGKDRALLRDSTADAGHSWSGLGIIRFEIAAAGPFAVRQSDALDRARGHADLNLLGVQSKHLGMVAAEA